MLTKIPKTHADSSNVKQPIVIVFLKSGAKVQQKNEATKKAAPKSISKK